MKVITIFLMSIFSAATYGVNPVPNPAPLCGLEISRKNILITGTVREILENEADKEFYNHKSPVDGKFLVFVPEDRVCDSEAWSLKGKKLQIISLNTRDLPLDKKLIIRAKVKGYGPYKVFVKEWRLP